MSPTPSEKRILQKRRATASGAVLVPLMEMLLEDECIPQDDLDFKYLDMLQRARALPRRKGVFSPSMLGSCLRQAYFAKRGVEKHLPRNPQTNGYFLKGNFVHFQWQFAVWKAHRAGLLELVTVPIGHEIDMVMSMLIGKKPGFEGYDMTEKEAQTWMDALNFYGDATRPGVEVRVIDGEWGGTIDALIKVRKPIYVVDFKGIHQMEFQRTIKNGAKQEYRKQIVGYAQIANHVLFADKNVITDCLLVSENKSGPMAGNGSPLALHETLVPVADFTGEVKTRLKTLRWFDHKNEQPPIECRSTSLMGFQECAFNRFCLDEVKVRQREIAAKAERKLPKNLKPARPQR